VKSLGQISAEINNRAQLMPKQARQSATRLPGLKAARVWGDPQAQAEPGPRHIAAGFRWGPSLDQIRFVGRKQARRRLTRLLWVKFSRGRDYSRRQTGAIPFYCFVSGRDALDTAPLWQGLLPLALKSADSRPWRLSPNRRVIRNGSRVNEPGQPASVQSARRAPGDSVGIMEDRVIH
jgi:hypothetical protein